jgi:imidazolonepropionase-like amidohydrolase
MKTWVLLAALCLSAPFARGQEEETRWVVRAEHVYTAVGAPIEGGHVSVDDGRIRSVGSGGGGGGDVLEVFAVTPGLIDLGARIDLGDRSVEASKEVQPALSIVHSLDLFDERWGREARSGVTAVLAAPADFDVIGGLAAVLKTAGPPTLAARLVREGAVLRGSMGTQPSYRNHPAFGSASDFYSRRPTTRMGVEWEFRKHFYDTIAARKDGSRAFPGSDVLERVLRGELPLVIQANVTQDIRTAIFLKEEFGIPRLCVDSAAEVWKEPELVRRSGVSVILPPLVFEGRVGPDGGFHAWDSAAELDQAGVLFALSGYGARDIESRLALQPGLAMRGGLSFEAALAAVTINPARIAGVEDRLGSLQEGKDADLVLWNGPPFQPTSRVVGVISSGRLILDPRSES